MYDVLREPWIPVKGIDGKRAKLGLLEVLQNAHKYEGLDLVDVTEEYSLYRFLLTFVASVYRPNKDEDVFDILEDNCLDMSKIEQYIAQCKSEGVSFDLFDKERPFLQFDIKSLSSKEEKEKESIIVSNVENSDGGKKKSRPKKVKKVDSANFEDTFSPIARLDITTPSGTEPLFWGQQWDKDVRMPIDVAFRKMLTYYVFPTTGGSGYKQGPNLQPPFFFLIKGKNLFETLVYSLPVITKNKNKQENFYDMELWRYPHVLDKDKNAVLYNQLFAMLYPARSIQLIEPKASELMSHCVFKGGFGVQKLPKDLLLPWLDYYVAYGKTDKGQEYSIKPTLDKAIWMNIGSLYSYALDSKANHISSILTRCEKLCEELNVQHLPISVFGLCTKPASAKFYKMIRGEVVFGKNIVNDVRKINLINNLVEDVEVISYELESQMIRAIGVIYKKNNKIKTDVKKFALRKGYAKHSIDDAKQRFFAKCEIKFYQVYKDLENWAENTIQDILIDWIQSVKEFAVEELKIFCGVLCRSAEDYCYASEAEKYLYFRIKGRRDRYVGNDDSEKPIDGSMSTVE